MENKKPFIRRLKKVEPAILKAVGSGIYRSDQSIGEKSLVLYALTRKGGERGFEGSLRWVRRRDYVSDEIAALRRGESVEAARINRVSMESLQHVLSYQAVIFAVTAKTKALHRSVEMVEFANEQAQFAA